MAKIAESAPSSASSSSSSTWSCLPTDLIDSILDRLPRLLDHVRFGAVCKSWNSSARIHYEERRSLASNHQLPWFPLRSERDASPDAPERWLYNFTTHQISNFRFHLPSYGALCGSCHGWLFLSGSLHLTVFNPLSGRMFRQLPHLAHRASPFDYVRCVTMSSRWPFEVVVVPWLSRTVAAHYRCGDKFWTYTKKMQHPKYFQNFIFYKKDLLGVSYDGEIFTLDTRSPRGKVMKMRKITLTTKLDSCSSYIRRFLVETTDGNLVLVDRYYHAGTDTMKAYKVYKLVYLNSNDHEQYEVIPIESLGGDCLFLGEFNQSISVSASNYPGCTPNTIYYAPMGGYESNLHIEAFNVEDQSFASRCFPDGYKRPSFTSWLLPSMQL